MKTYKVAVIPGDGIGPEVINEGIKVIEAAASLEGTFQVEFTNFPWGCEYYLEHGRMMDEDGTNALMQYDAIYLGAVGFPGVPDHISLWDLLLRIRKEFDQYVNIRPIKLLRGAPNILKNIKEENIDMLFIRENSEGEYSGAGERLFRGKPEEIVMQTGIFTRKGTERIIRYAFETARNLNKSLTSISKGNALNYSMVFWDEVFEEIGKEYPDVQTASYLVDAAAMLMIKQPHRFEVVVTSNLFGDILTDLGAAIAGGLGLAAGANINPDRIYPSMFEPIHGSAPDIAGQGIANPLAAIWSAGQLLEFLGYRNLAEKLIAAIEHVLVESMVLTPDLGGTSSTSEVGSQVVEKLSEIYKVTN
ncbi:tartrate dehydrogenase [Bacillus infantis]|uniref:tartrate dehydrogenase n=1 Tax=Bacillus infantis TaxID=324767 RepID=UPI003CED29EB